MQGDSQIKDEPNARRIRTCVAPLILISTVLASNAGLLADIVPQLDLLVHFQVQYAWVLAACLAYFLLRRKLGWTLLAVAALSLPVIRIAPWYMSSPALDHQQTQQTQTTRALLSCNVKFTNNDYERLLELIQVTDADVVVVQEATPEWALALGPLNAMYPHRIAHPVPGPRGMVLLSKLPLLRPKVEVHSTTQHCVLVGWIELDGQEVQIIAAHPFRPGLRHGPTLLASELEMAVDLANNDTRNVILIGDLNTTMWSRTYTRFVENYRFSNLRKGHGILASWSRVVPWLSAIPIDHCLIGKNLHGVSFDLLPIAGSDHDAIHALVQLKE